MTKPTEFEKIVLYSLGIFWTLIIVAIIIIVLWVVLI